MANFVDNQIKFLLEVTARDPEGCGEIDSNSPIDIKLNLNPDDRIIKISEAFATREHLVMIFKRIITLLETIDERTATYSEALDILAELQEPGPEGKPGFIKGYEANFKPPFEKIDKIIFRHQSPGEAGVSYTRSFNGDRRPSNL
jgi:hypothetical protein